jgi:ATP-dependent Clp protease ATP-binding subunit ClpC
MRTIIHFPIFWFVDAPRRFILIIPKAIEFLENRFAIGLHTRYLFVPLFQDTTFVGRIISLTFRLFRIFAGILAVLVAGLALTLAFVFWLALPFLIIFIFKLFGPLVLVLVTVVYQLLARDRPLRKISGSPHKDTLATVATGKLRRVFTTTFKPSVLIPTLSFYPSINRLFTKMGVEQKAFLEKFREKIKKADLPLEKEELFQKSIKKARLLSASYVDVDHLFLAAVEEVKPAKEALFELGIHLHDVMATAEWIVREIKIKRRPRIWDEDYVLKKLGGVNLAWTARPTPTLDRFSVDLTALAQKGRLAKTVGKKKAIEETIQVLSRANRDNVLILGEPGCGKTMMVSGLAQQIIAGGVEPALFSKRIVSLAIPKIFAGTGAQGEREGILINILEEVKNAGNVILFIDEIHNLAGAGEGSASLNVFAAFEPYLSTSQFQMIGTTSWANYRAYIEPNEVFANLFQIVNLPEATTEEAIEILELITVELEKKHRVAVSYPALKKTVELSERFIHDRVLPDKSVALLEEVAVAVERQKPQGMVIAEDVARVVAAKTSIPLTQITYEESERLLGLEEKLHERIIDQEAAITAIADALRRARVGLREEERPIASLLFIGPTGVGKTEMAKALTEVYFGDEEAMVRLDMSEYQTKEAIAQLLGTPPSTKGGRRGGALTDPIRRRPFALLLLDEIEKAHPDILNIFLAILDDGRATDGSGRLVRFNNAIIIATSNAGTYLFEEATKHDWTREQTEEKLIKEALPKYFRPEFLNRFDGVIICETLSPSDILAIVKLKLKKLAEKIAKKDIYLSFSDGLAEALARRGFHPTMGARPLRRLIAVTLESYLAKKMLSGKIKRGDTVKLGEEILK